MNATLFITFLLAVTVLVIIPGPIVTLVVANSLHGGTRRGLATVAGSSAGTALLIAGGAAGLSALLAFLSEIFEIVRWLGAAYLIWLGINAWRAQGAAPSEGLARPTSRTGRAVFLQGMLVATTNPKTILFYVAFFPQFIDPRRPALPQLLGMSVAMILIAIVSDSTYAVLAGRLRFWFADPRRRRVQARITGSLLIGTGFGMLLARRG
jgi:homoserine/homoserine lactone efflux protein